MKSICNDIIDVAAADANYYFILWKYNKKRLKHNPMFYMFLSSHPAIYTCYMFQYMIHLVIDDRNSVQAVVPASAVFVNIVYLDL